MSDASCGPAPHFLLSVATEAITCQVSLPPKSDASGAATHVRGRMTASAVDRLSVSARSGRTPNPLKPVIR